jgi:hypothetical protein
MAAIDPSDSPVQDSILAFSFKFIATGWLFDCIY